MSIWCATAPAAIPPIFVNQLVHVILRNALDGCEDPLRAACGRTVLPAATADLA